MNRLLLLFLLLSQVVLLSCSDSAGATSETTNGVAVITPEGNPAADVAIFIRKSDKLLNVGETPESVYVRTDEKGFFNIDSSLALDRYIIELTDSNGLGYQLSPDTMNGELAFPDTIKLLQQGQLIGSVKDLAADFNLPQIEGTDLTVQIYGLDRVTRINDKGNFTFADLPPGDVRLHIVSDAKDTIAESDKVEIFPDDTTNAGNYIIGSLSDEIALIYELFLLNDLDTATVYEAINIYKGHITDIYLDNRGIHTLIPEIGYLQLKTFSCAKNNITSVPKEFGNLVTLYYIDLSYNQIQYIPEELANMTKCSEIDIEHNQLRDIPLSFTNPNKLTHLDEIHVKNNHLTELPYTKEQWLDKYSYEKSWRYYQTEWKP